METADAGPGERSTRNNNHNNGRANRQPATGTAGPVRATRIGTGQTASGHGDRESYPLLQATDATQSSTSFATENGRRARFTGRNQSTTSMSGPGGRTESTREAPIGPDAAAQFLRAFPSKQCLSERLPELSRMDPFEYPTASDFEQALDRELGEKESTRLKQRFAPAAIQAGLKQLVSQETQGGTAPVRLSDSDVTLLMEVKSHTCLVNDGDISETIARTDTLPNELATRLAPADRDRFASMAKISDYDPEAFTERYAYSIKRVLDRMKSDDPRLWRAFAGERRNSNNCKLDDDFLKGFLREAKFLKFPAFFQERAFIQIFFEQIFPMECSERLLKSASRLSRVGMPHPQIDIIIERFSEYIGKEVAKEFHLSAVLSELSDSDYFRRPRFEKLFISSFRKLLETGDFRKANKEFLVPAMACWPGLPVLENDEGWKGLQCPSDVELVKKARQHVAEARAKAARSNTAQLSEFGRNAPPEMRRYVENVLYYFYLAAAKFEEAPHGNTWDWLETDTGFIVRTRTPVWQLYAEFVDLLVTTELYRTNS